MPTSMPQFWFRSILFNVAPDEDAETNPFCYGRELAEWIKSRFMELGYEPEEVIPEDWGWCVMLQRHPFLLWIGCGNVHSEFLYSMSPEEKDRFVPDGSSFTWTCFVGTDVFIWQKFFWTWPIGRSKTDKWIHKVSTDLESVLLAEKAIQLVDEP